MKLQQLITELETKEKPAFQNPQFQVKKDAFFQGRLAETPDSELTLEAGEIRLAVQQFAYTSNNITYAILGNRMNYWQFFPAAEAATDWGVIPVWGFAEIVASNVEELAVGERIFGYFPPAKQIKMRPVGIKQKRFIDGSEHRSSLPAGYNVYTRVKYETGYDATFDQARMLLFPLHITSYFIWDMLQENNWYGAEQIIILSASSKTSTGLGYALQADKNAPKTVGVTSASHLASVEQINIYDQCFTYEQIEEIDTSIPSLIVDMSGNAKVLLALHRQLADNMKFTLNVGLTHWMNASAKPLEGMITARSQFFFVPAQIQKRMKEWGIETYHHKTTTFLKATALKSKAWLNFRVLDSLEALAAVHPEVCEGKIPATEGIIVDLM
ncbi:MAG: DUF2855 family protein [Bacteroidota bacterium]